MGNSKQIKNISYELCQIAELISADLRLNGKNSNHEISGIATLANAGNEHLSFFTNKIYKQDLATSKAGVVITSPQYADLLKTAVLIVDNPHLAYAKVAELFIKKFNKKHAAGIHHTALIGDNCKISESASIGPYVVIGDNVEVADDVVINNNTSIGDNCIIAADTYIYPRVSIYSNVSIGSRCIIHSGAVIGSDGFGFARDHKNNNKWYKVEQLGGVVIGSDVEIGANTAIDCGALDDTIISDGVKLDNQIQIAHNVFIGEHSVFAGQVAIAGSTKIGRHCAFGGDVSVAGHLNITDGVNLAGTAVVGQSILEPGVYASGTGSAMPFQKWRRASVNFENSDKLVTKVRALEACINEINKNEAINTSD